jgi:hypothetical protein
MSEKTKLVCPKCGVGQSRGSHHCNKCGTALFASPTPAAAVSSAAAGVPAKPSKPAIEKPEGGDDGYSETFKKIL